MSSNDASPAGLLAADVGNTRVKLGWFPSAAAGCVAEALASPLPISVPRLPEPAAIFSQAPADLADSLLAEWLDGLGFVERPRVALASVSGPAEQLLSDRLQQQRFAIERVASETAPIALGVDEPSRIGVDRVMAAVAANRLRRADTPAIVVDVGTAITVDLISATGTLEGGAILPGPTTAGRALADTADRLPDVLFGELDYAPDAVGRSTIPAIEAGLFWGAVGAIRELIARQRDRLTAAPQVFLTGGAAPSVARLIGGPDLSVRYVPHLTLSGIAVAAGHDRR